MTAKLAVIMRIKPTAKRKKLLSKRSFINIIIAFLDQQKTTLAGGFLLQLFNLLRGD